MMLARHCGLRGQTVVNVNRKQIVDHDLTGKAQRTAQNARGKAKHDELLHVQPQDQALVGLVDAD